MLKLAPTRSAFANPHTADVIQLIADYQRAARIAVSSLRRESKNGDPLTAWRRGRLKRSGRLKEPKGRYSFHGSGCRFIIADRTVDVDFGPGGRYDGFDSWRLAQYAGSAFEWRELGTRDIDGALKELSSRKMIIRPQWDPTPHLYYFRDDVE